MIGCLILGTFVAVGAARLIHRRHHACGGPFGGHFGHGFGGGPFGHMRRHMHRHVHGFGGWGGWHGEPGDHRGHGWGGWGGFGHGPQAANDAGYDDNHANDGDEGWGGSSRGGMSGFILSSILGRVRATATQERVIRAAVDEFRAEMKNVGGGEAKKTRQDIGSAMRNPNFDEVFMGELFARQDTAIEKTRKAFVGLMAKVHDVLDEEQRGRMADLVEKGPRFWKRRFD
jgi:hypothetical protein